MNQVFEIYLKAIQEKGPDGTEVDYRTPLENLLNAIKPEDIKYKVTHEPHREKEFGAPDFQITSKGLTIGYIETKKLDEDISEIRKTDQIKRYLKVSPNMIITNYRDFLLIKDGKDVEKISLFDFEVLSKKRAKLNPENVEKLERIFEIFFSCKPIDIAKVSVLAEELAKRGKLLKEFIVEEIKKGTDEEYPKWLNGLYDQFKKTLIGDLTEEGFADAFSQTLIYGLILAGIEKRKQLERVSAYSLIPKSFSVIYELFRFFSTQDPPNRFAWIYDEIIAIINATDYHSISEELMYSGGHHEQDDYDPYYYFYEPFLKKIDAIQKKEKGVYYTPIPVVSFIIRSLDKILKEKFDVQGGFLNEKVTTLDFACGTGTFLAEIFKHILNRLKETRNEGQIPKKISEHILKNFYGFEYLVAPYAIAHLKLARLIEELAGGYSFGDKERLQIYLTDTLNHSDHTINPIFQAISEEGKKANEIKRKDKILVVTGNPPYNVGSKNKSQWLDENLPIYKPEGEKNIQPLNDDYIKFIRFAHFKMAQVEKGVIGIITNNSFINGLIHRKMRAELLKEFDEIYILNLHGNARIGETAPDGGADQNVFDIMQGVCISFFVKNPLSLGKLDSVPLDKGDKCAQAHRGSKIFYYDFWGKRNDKFRLLRDNDLGTIEWKELNYAAFDNAFNKTRWGKRFPYFKFFTPTEETKIVLEYGDAWGMDGIFGEYKSGIKSHGDAYKTAFTSQELENNINGILNNDNAVLNKLNLKNKDLEETKGCFPNGIDKDEIKRIHYRPFDNREILYNLKFITRHRYDLMRHFLAGENVGLAFSRQIISDEWKHCFATDTIVDGCTVSIKTREWTYVAPLYLYEEQSENLLGETKTKNPNFTKEFIEFISQKYSKKPSPEEIFGYIYAILYCPTYREKYLELLKIDFPRVPFIDDERLFYELSALGWELVQHHLMKKTYEFISNYPIAGTDEIEFVKPSSVPPSSGHLLPKGEGNNPLPSGEGAPKARVRAWINKEQYFDNIPEEVWDFYIGGYQVLDHWLKARKGRVLSNSEITTFKQIVSILDFTIGQMEKIEEVAGEMI